MRRLALVLALSLGMSGVAFAQTIVPPVQQSGQRLDAATLMCTNTSSGTLNAVNTVTTATCTPPAGQYVYVTAFNFDVCTNGTGSAVTNVTYTSTNLTGSPVWVFSLGATADICQHWGDAMATPLKSSQPGVAVTVVSPAAATNNSYSLRVYAYYGP